MQGGTPLVGHFQPFRSRDMKCFKSETKNLSEQLFFSVQLKFPVCPNGVFDIGTSPFPSPQELFFSWQTSDNSAILLFCWFVPSAADYSAVFFSISHQLCSTLYNLVPSPNLRVGAVLFQRGKVALLWWNRGTSRQTNTKIKSFCFPRPVKEKFTLTTDTKQSQKMHKSSNLFDSAEWLCSSWLCSCTCAHCACMAATHIHNAIKCFIVFCVCCVVISMTAAWTYGGSLQGFPLLPEQEDLVGKSTGHRPTRILFDLPCCKNKILLAVFKIPALLFLAVSISDKLH